MVREDSRVDDDVACWFALLRAPACNSTLLVQLLEVFRRPTAIFEADEQSLRGAGLAGPALEYFLSPDWAGVERDLRWLGQPGTHLITISDPGYPLVLRQIADPPPALLVRGHPSALNNVQLAIVGSRNPSPAGRRIAYQFAFDLSTIGLTITSGLAVGIDSHAHHGAVDAKGPTVAVLGNGIDSVYPKQNQRLADAVVESGALVSEFPTGYPALAANFPRRNRIISGLSVGTLVVEAARRSGSLITARHALEQGREVFAVPGSIRNPTAQGCHELLRQGAKLAECNEDILEEIGPLAAVAAGVPGSSGAGIDLSEGLDGTSKVLLDNIGHEPVHIDSLIEITDLPAGIAASALSSLEIAGLIESLPGGNFIRR